MTPQLRQLLSAYMQGLNRAITLVRVVRESPYISDDAKALAESAMAQIQTTIDAIRPTPKPFHEPSLPCPKQMTLNTTAPTAQNTPTASANSTAPGTGTTEKKPKECTAPGGIVTSNTPGNSAGKSTSAAASMRSSTKPVSGSSKEVVP